MKRSIFFYIFLLCLGLISCKSNQRLAQTQHQTAQLSQQFGFKITQKDDIRLYSEAALWLGTPYRFGGTTRKGVDCSGFIGQIYQNVYHKNLERQTINIAKKNCRKISKGKLKTGDLVFFNTSQKKKKGINHVGLFLKHNYFIHASSSQGVIVSNLNENYYRKTWKQGGVVK